MNFSTIQHSSLLREIPPNTSKKRPQSEPGSRNQMKIPRGMCLKLYGLLQIYKQYVPFKLIAITMNSLLQKLEKYLVSILELLAKNFKILKKY